MKPTTNENCRQAIEDLRDLAGLSEKHEAAIETLVCAAHALGILKIRLDEGRLVKWKLIDTYDFEKCQEVFLAFWCKPSEAAEANGSKPFWDVSYGRCYDVVNKKFTGILGGRPDFWLPKPSLRQPAKRV